MTTNSEKGHHGPLQPHPPELRERGYKLYEAGKSNREIAAELGIPVSTLARWSSKGQWKLRRQLAARGDAQNGLVLANADDALNDDKISQLTFGEKQRQYTETMANYALRVARTVKGLSPQGLIAYADKISKLDAVARKALNLEENKPPVVVNLALLAGGETPRLVRRAQKAPAADLPSSETAHDGKQPEESSTGAG